MWILWKKIVPTDISWAMTLLRDLSPAMRVGVTKVRQGFSIPPDGKLGGRIRMSNTPQTYLQIVNQKSLDSG